jgi:hypothetical protein
MCSAGKYNTLPGCIACDAQVDTDCIKCEMGTASSAIGRNTTCDACREGKYSYPPGQPGATACRVCPNGTFSLARSGLCTACDLGWWALAGSANCTACPRNTFLDIPGQGGEESCRPCPTGSISLARGNSDPTCSACPPGTYQLEGECTSCTPGSYSKSGSVVCSPCLAGTYSEAKATSCLDCPMGTYSGTNYSGACSPCLPGLFGEYTGASTCLQCRPGTTSDTIGAINCSLCHPGQYASSGASEVQHNNTHVLFHFSPIEP